MRERKLTKEQIEWMFCNTWINQMLEPYKVERKYMKWEKEVRERIQKGMQDAETSTNEKESNSTEEK